MRISVLLALAAFSVWIHAADFNPLPIASTILDPEKEGQELAARLRASAPVEASEINGFFAITTRDDEQNFVPIVSRVSLSATNWQAVYQSAPTNGALAERLVITHTPGQPTIYNLTVGTTSLTNAPLHRPFAGSDFWLLDLGLEFFHWPRQRAVSAEMTRGRACRVLESIRPKSASDGYSRVLSWVDNESGGVIRAEAYDQQDKLLKRFAVGSFTKVEGQWQLRDMLIKNSRTGQQTKLEFDLKPE